MKFAVPVTVASERRRRTSYQLFLLFLEMFSWIRPVTAAISKDIFEIDDVTKILSAGKRYNRNAYPNQDIGEHNCVLY